LGSQLGANDQTQHLAVQATNSSRSTSPVAHQIPMPSAPPLLEQTSQKLEPIAHTEAFADRKVTQLAKMIGTDGKNPACQGIVNAKEHQEDAVKIINNSRKRLSGAF